VSVMQRLKGLDDRLARDRERGRYDTVRPWWFYYSGLLMFPLSLGVVLAATFTSGPLRPILIIVSLLSAVVLVTAVTTWRRRHRVQGQVAANDVFGR
jgi:hypothetical protein